jgi:hypothetical protein
MKLESLKDIEQLMKLCRKHNVSTLTVDGVTMHMAPIDELQSDLKNTTDSVTKEQLGFDPSKLTDEQILNWSSGVPEILNG